MAERKTTVFVYLPGETQAVPAGIFTHDDSIGIGGFAYGRKYRELSNAVSVDPIALSLAAPIREARTNKGLYGAFRDAAPDLWGRLVIAKGLMVPPEALTEIDFLVEANATRVGALDFRPSPESLEPVMELPNFSALEDMQDAARLMQEGKTIHTDLLNLMRQGSSIGGARPKCTVEWNDALWIAKFSAVGDTINLPRIEYATMKLAEKCGIRVPPMQMEAVGGKDVFLIKRFDRTKSGSGWLRQGFLSALSFMQWDETDYHLWSYGALAQTMRKHVSINDIKELFSRMVFNILVRNTDDHPRNHGFSWNGDQAFLSPAYDITPSLARKGVNTEFGLVMHVGSQGKMADLNNAVSQCEGFGLSKEEAVIIIDRLQGIVKGWREVFLDAGVTEIEVSALAPSFIRCFDPLPEIK